MLEKIHYIIATLCGIAMVGITVTSEQGEYIPWAVTLAGLYLASKILLLGKK